MTQAAGSLLVRYGLISADQLVEAERVRQREGGTLGECLLRLHILDEEQLVEFYHKRLMIPRVEARQLERVSRRALAVVPADMCAEFRVFPADLDSEGTITLVMADPSDTHISDEVMFFTGKFCQRAVARESLLREAIERHYNVHFSCPAVTAPVEWRPSDNTQRGTPAPPELLQLDEEEEPLLLTQVKRSEATPLPAPAPQRDATIELDIRDVDLHLDPNDVVDPIELALPGVSVVPLTQRKVPQAPEAPILLTRPVMRADSKTPTLTGMPTVAIPDPPLATLRATATRDQIAATLLDYIGAMTPRAAMFVMRQGVLAGHDGRGTELDASAVKRMVIPVDAPSLFRDVIQSRLPYRGPLPETPANRAFVQMIGPYEGEVLLLPISVRDRVIALLYADGVASILPDAALHAVSREAGLAYERVILAAKSAPPDTFSIR